MKREGHPELTALAWAALAAIRRSKEAAAVADADDDDGDQAADPIGEVVT